jgi:hypothetical protein
MSGGRADATSAISIRFGGVGKFGPIRDRETLAEEGRGSATPFARFDRLAGSTTNLGCKLMLRNDLWSW